MGQQPPENGRWKCICTKRRWIYVEISCLALVMVVVWVSLALPVIFFYLPVPSITPPDFLMMSSNNCTGISSGCGDTPTLSNVTEDIDEVVKLPAGGTITCNDDFFPVRGADNTTICAPQCPGYHQHPLQTSLLVDKVVLVGSCVGVVSAVAVLILAVVRRHHIFKFPTVFVVYLTITMLVLDLFFVINFIDREALFCKSRNLLVSLLDPTPFCIISGVVFYYALVQITLWWFFHICALFWSFRFPLHFRSYRNHLRHIHLILVLLALILPMIPVVVVMSDYAVNDRGDPAAAKGLGYGIINLPPILCAGLDPNATFYSLNFFITVMTEIGMTLLILTFWDVRKSTKHKSKVKRGQFQIGSGEKKILIVLIYYAILNVFALMAFTLAIRNANQFRHAVKWNFLCESRGHYPDSPCDRSQVDGLKYPEVNIVAYFMLVSIPSVNFIYILNYRKMKYWFCVHILRDRSRVYTRSSSSYSTSRFNSTSDMRQFSLSSSIKINTVEYNIEDITGTDTKPIGRSISENGNGPYPDMANGDLSITKDLPQTNNGNNSLPQGNQSLEGTTNPLSPTGELFNCSTAV